MNLFEEDILEYALNNGIPAAAYHFQIDKEAVYAIVKAFKNEVDSNVDKRCFCQKVNQQGGAMMCFVCEGPVEYERIKL